MVKGLGALALLGCTLATTGPVSAQQGGDRLSDGTVVEFVLPAGTPITAGTGDDFLVFTRRADAVVTDGGTCFAGTRSPLQSAVAIDPGHGSYQVNVIVTEVDGTINPSPVPPGTKLSSLVSLGGCGAGGEYERYRGVVE